MFILISELLNSFLLNRLPGIGYTSGWCFMIKSPSSESWRV